MLIKKLADATKKKADIQKAIENAKKVTNPDTAPKNGKSLKALIEEANTAKLNAERELKKYEKEVADARTGVPSELTSKLATAQTNLQEATAKKTQAETAYTTAKEAYEKAQNDLKTYQAKFKGIDLSKLEKAKDEAEKKFNAATTLNGLNVTQKKNSKNNSRRLIKNRYFHIKNCENSFRG